MHSPPLIAAILAGFFLVLFVLERIAPLRRAIRPLLPRLLVNLALSALAIATAAATVRPAAAFMLRWITDRPFGLLHLVPLPPIVRTALAFLLMDLTFYYWHRANHRLAFLWRFHNAHHIDPALDVSTGFRFHPGEVALSAFFRAAQVALIGMSVTVFATYEIVFQLVTLFEHSNLRLPLPLERALNRILVTPRMHGIHHSHFRRETDSNYSIVFPWWDWLHRTLHLGVHQAAITIGVPAYAKPDDNRISHTLLMPALPQRDYWRDSIARPGWDESKRGRMEE